jgi:hypothetical protein
MAFTLATKLIRVHFPTSNSAEIIFSITNKTSCFWFRSAFNVHKLIQNHIYAYLLIANNYTEHSTGPAATLMQQGVTQLCNAEGKEEMSALSDCERNCSRVFEVTRVTSSALIKCMARVKVRSEITGWRKVQNSSQLVLISRNKYVKRKDIPHFF